MADNPSIYLSVPSPSFVEVSTTLAVGITSFGSYVEGGSGGTLAPNASLILEKVNGPASEGELYLSSSKIDDNPLEKVILSDAYRSFRFPNQTLPSGGNVSSPTRFNSVVKNTLANYCKKNVATIYHYCTVVVDSSFKVIGVDALRVVDSSVFSISPGTNPQATLMMFATWTKFIK